jgi:hypothetical protein
MAWLAGLARDFSLLLDDPLRHWRKGESKT